MKLIKGLGSSYPRKKHAFTANNYNAPYGALTCNIPLCKADVMPTLIPHSAQILEQWDKTMSVRLPSGGRIGKSDV